jgi:type IV pilus assembly protein PilO
MSALEQLAKISLGKKIAGLALLVVLVSAGFYFFHYEGIIQELHMMENQHAKLMKEKGEAERRRATYEKDRARRDELKKSYGQQLRALPTDTEMSSFLNSLNMQADVVGLNICSVTPESESASQYYARIPVKLELTGSYHQFAKFFFLVGNLDRIINIENLEFSRDSVSDSGISLKANVLATTFRSVEAGTAKAGAKKH